MTEVLLRNRPRNYNNPNCQSISNKGRYKVKVLDITQGDARRSGYLELLTVCRLLERGCNFSVGLEAQVIGPEDNLSPCSRVKRQMGRRVILREVNKKPYEISALYLERRLTRVAANSLWWTWSLPLLCQPALQATNARILCLRLNLPAKTQVFYSLKRMRGKYSLANLSPQC